MTYTLRPFQKELVDYFEPPNATFPPETVMKSRLVGDDMGLGKTLEASVMDERSRVRAKTTGAQQWPLYTLVTCPKSMLHTWGHHYKRFHPGAKVIMIDPQNRKKFVDELKLAAKGASKYHIFLVHWEGHRTIAKDTADSTKLNGLSALQKVRWHHIIADEVHRIKNRGTILTVEFKRCQAGFRTALSGTWADNKPDDAWSVLNWLWPKEFSSYNIFYERYVDYDLFVKTDRGIEKYDRDEPSHQGAPRIKKVVGVLNPDELQGRLKKLGYMRRRKDQVLTDLPEKIYDNVWVKLGPKQRRAYDQMRKEMLAWLGEHEDMPAASPTVLSQLMRLSQFSLAYAEMVPGMIVKTIDGVKTKVPGMVVRLTDPSAKLDAFMDWLGDLPETEQVVVFSASKQMINLLAKRLEKTNTTYALFTGDTSHADRERIVDAFQAGSIRIFAGTIQAGGEGITLTAASEMVFFDRVWNPSKNRQAEDREHRIGQVHTVRITDFVSQNTTDFGKNQEIKVKWGWLQDILGDDVRDYQEAMVDGEVTVQIG